MVEQGGLPVSRVTAGLHEQLARRLEWACSLPNSCEYKFYAGRDLLDSQAPAGGSEMASLLWRCVRAHASEVEITRALAALRGNAFQVSAPAILDKLSLSSTERLCANMLRSSQLTVESLEGESGSIGTTKRRLLYFLLLTHSIRKTGKLSNPSSRSDWAVRQRSTDSGARTATGQSPRPERPPSGSAPGVPSSTDAPAALDTTLPRVESLSPADRAERAAHGYKLAKMWIGRENWTAAEKELRSAQEAQPERIDIGAAMAWLKCRRGSPTKEDILKVSQILAAAIRECPDDTDLRLFRAYLHKRIQREDLAIKDYAAVRRLDPNNVQALREIRLYRMRQERATTSKGRLSKLFRR